MSNARPPDSRVRPTRRCRAVPERLPLGFSLVELLIAVAAAAILAALAYASYAEHIRKAHRAEARRALVEAAQALERNYSVAARYDLDAAGRPMATGTTPNSPPFPEHIRQVGTDRGSGVLYELFFAEPPTATAWAMVAVRKPGSIMATDACGDYLLDSSGRRRVIRAAAAAAGDSCWTRGMP